MSTYIYVEDDGQMVVGCCDGAHEAMYPLDDPQAVDKLLAALAEAGVLEVEKRPGPMAGRYFTEETWEVRYVSPWKEAK